MLYSSWRGGDKSDCVESNLLFTSQKVRKEEVMKNILFLLTTVVIVGGFHIVPAWTSSPAPEQGQAQVVFEVPSEGPTLIEPEAWTDDVLVTNPTVHQERPSMARAHNGDLYVAVERLELPRFDVYRSTDGGESWSWWTGIQANADDLRNPSITYAEKGDGSENWIYVAVCWAYSGNQRNVTVFRFDADSPTNWSYSNVTTGHYMSDYIYPEICTDYLDLSPYDVYVTYAVRSIDYSPVYFSRSSNYGQNWSTPQNVTGGSENTSYLPRPDIAYGSDNGNNNLFIAFVKPGWTGSSWDNQIWVTKSTNYGSSWDTPVQLTSSTKNVYHSRVAAAMNVDSAVVAYTREWSSTDNDICYVYSTNGGATWSGQQELAASGDDEESVELSVSHSDGKFHAAFWRDCDIRYTSTDAGNPSSWAATIAVNEGNTATCVRPAVSVNPTRPLDEEACVAWTDYRGTHLDVYFDAPPQVSDPVADIKANGSDDPITISSTTNLIVTVELDPGDSSGDNADWWVLADAGGGTWYYYHLSGAWYPGGSATYQGPLAALSPYEVLNYTGLSPGTYVFYFGVDMNMNGTIDLGDLFYDSVTVTVQ